ncbi:MAG: hypothetical protein GY694_18895 [Gammaproteobacteria bacterium]|nr:hypothetical protein [Gammaproteobacteria bacterium]
MLPSIKPYSFRINSLPKKEKGQAIVYVLVFTTAILMSVLMLYNSGKLTSEKMQLQNAADATAYSISLLEARELNFTAYTNRAMIGNEIAIAQLVGLFSWFDMWSSTMDFFDLYIIKPLDILAGSSGGLLSALTTAMGVILDLLQAGVNAIKTAIAAIAKIATIGVAAINLVYSYAQEGMHYVTIFMTVSTLSEVITDNAPNAKLSEFGFFALAAHMMTYYASSVNPVSFVQHNDSTESEDFGQFMRQQYAATVNGSRDDFSLDRDGGFSYNLFSLSDLGLFPINVTLDLALVATRFRIDMDMGIDLERRGGTDLRYKEKSGKQYYSWSGVDIIAMEFWYLFQLTVDVYTILTGWDNIIDWDLDFSFDIPLGIGTGQIASSKGVLTTSDMWNSEDEEYGGAPGDLPVTFNFVAFPPYQGAAQKMANSSSKIYTKHKGLPGFNSVTPVEAMDALQDAHPSFDFQQDLGFTAPYLVIGLVIDKEDVTTSEDVMNSNSSNSLNLDNDLQDGELGTLAKSEVYFSRPTDSLASHFNREDGRTEYGSTYNPFWQARLVDTGIAERVLALLVQQKQIWALSGVSFNLPGGLGEFDLNDILSDLGLI